MPHSGYRNIPELSAAEQDRQERIAEDTAELVDRVAEWARVEKWADAAAQRWHPE